MTYKITEEQWRVIAKALDAATLVAAAAPTYYTRTPMGNLADLVSDATSILFWAAEAAGDGPDDRG